MLRNTPSNYNIAWLATTRTKRIPARISRLILLLASGINTTRPVACEPLGVTPMTRKRKTTTTTHSRFAPILHVHQCMVLRRSLLVPNPKFPQLLPRHQLHPQVVPQITQLHRHQDRYHPVGGPLLRRISLIKLPHHRYIDGHHIPTSIHQHQRTDLLSIEHPDLHLPVEHQIMVIALLAVTLSMPQ